MRNELKLACHTLHAVEPCDNERVGVGDQLCDGQRAQFHWHISHQLHNQNCMISECSQKSLLQNIVMRQVFSISQLSSGPRDDLDFSGR